MLYRSDLLRAARARCQLSDQIPRGPCIYFLALAVCHCGYAICCSAVMVCLASLQHSCVAVDSLSHAESSSLARLERRCFRVAMIGVPTDPSMPVLPCRAAVHSAYNQNFWSADVCCCHDNTAVLVHPGFKRPVQQQAVSGAMVGLLPLFLLLAEGDSPLILDYFLCLPYLSKGVYN